MEPSSPRPHSFKDRLKAFFKQYGKLGLGIYIGVGCVSFGSCYLAIRSGVDAKSLIHKLGLPDSGLWDNAGTIAVAYAIHKILLPLRLFITIALTTFIAKKTRWRLPKGTSGSGQAKR